MIDLTAAICLGADEEVRKTFGDKKIYSNHNIMKN